MNPLAHFVFQEVVGWTLTNDAEALNPSAPCKRYRQFIAAFVLRVADVSSHQFKTQFVHLSQLVQLLPLFDIFHGLESITGFSPPAPAFPILDPLGEALFEVGTVGHDMHACRSLQGLQTLDESLQFHLVVGGLGDRASLFHVLSSG